MKKLVELRAKRLVYLKENNDEDEKAKDTKKCFMKNLKFEGYKKCLEAAEIKSNIKHFKKYKIQAYSLKEDQNEFINNNKLILEQNKDLKVKAIRLLSSNDNKRMQLKTNDSIDTYVYGMSKDLVSKKEEIKSNKTIKQHRTV